MSGDILGLYRKLRKQLNNIGISNVPTMNSIATEAGSREMLRIIEKLADQVIEMKRAFTENIENREKQIQDERCKQASSITRYKKRINMKRQQLQDLKAQLNKEDLMIKQDKKDNILKMRPLQRKLDHLQRQCAIRCIE